MSTFVIGDQHGAGLELQKLLEKISPSATDTVYLVGDCFDRGIHGVLVWDLIHKYDMKVIRGNHEQKMINYFHGNKINLPPHYKWFLNELINVKKKIDFSNFLYWLENLPILVNTPSGLITHAGVNIFTPEVPDLSSNVYGYPIRGVTGHEWWSHYTKEKLVVYGHLVTKDLLPRIYHSPNGEINSVGLDTAVVHGGPSTCICLETKEIITYRSSKDWYNIFCKEYKGLSKKIKIPQWM